MTMITESEAAGLDRYWRAANYLCVGQIYLRANPLLREPLRAAHIKSRLLGHWGTCPGLNLIYAHLNRLIRRTGVPAVYIAGPGHGGPALLANTWMEGSYTETYPQVTPDLRGLQKLFEQFSWPGGVPSHVAPQVPGSIHEGGELGYSLAHAFGVAFDNPELLVACVVGDGEAETGPLAAGWQSIHFLNPARDGAVLPILHLNGYKIAGPTVMGRASDDDLKRFFSGLGYDPRFVTAAEPMRAHRDLAAAVDLTWADILKLRTSGSADGRRAKWPMIVLRSPKGWTCPAMMDGQPLENSFRAHQVPVTDPAGNPGHLKLLEDWMRSYRPEELFDDAGALRPDIRALAPDRGRRMGTSPHANGGALLKPLELPDFKAYAVPVPEPGVVRAEATRQLGRFLRDVFRQNAHAANFRLFCPDETSSNRLEAVFEATGRCWMEPLLPSDANLSPDGRVMEVLSEHCCEGWLEGYLLSGRHGLFPCYEAFITIVDSMVNQHAKWLKTCRELPWRRPIASLNILLTSHAWRQDHNGYSHQGPGFINTVLQKKSSVARIYLPPDANCLLSVADHCLRSRDYINLVVCGKQPELQWLNADAAVEHCREGASVWEWAGSDSGGEPDVVMAAAGDVPTLETMAAVWLLRQRVPGLRVRVVNVVDLMALLPHQAHPHGLDEAAFESLFTDRAPVIFAFHGYPRVIHELIYRRARPDRFHVRGYIEEGATTTPFDMTVCNRLSRFHLAMAALERVPRLRSEAADVIEEFESRLRDHQDYIRREGEDLPEIRDWVWSPSAGTSRAPATRQLATFP